MNTPGDFYVTHLHPMDLSRLVEIENACYPDPWERGMFLGELQGHPISLPLGGRLRIDSAETILVGMCICHLLDDELRILNVAIHPDHRRKGYARRLMTTALNRAAGTGVKRASLEVRVSNSSAQRLYLSLGFRVTGRRKNYYTKQNEDALLMTLEGLESSYPDDLLEDEAAKKGATP